MNKKRYRDTDDNLFHQKKYKSEYETQKEKLSDVSTKNMLLMLVERTQNSEAKLHQLEDTTYRISTHNNILKNKINELELANKRYLNYIYRLYEYMGIPIPSHFAQTPSYII